jgi:hypothetical protein
MALKKIILAKNPKLFAFDFTEKCRYVPKTDINSIFLIHDHNIPDRLYIMVLYISFYGF